MTLCTVEVPISADFVVVGREAITFNLDQTSRYTANYQFILDGKTGIDVIDYGGKNTSKKVSCFSNVISSGNPTPYYDPIVSTWMINFSWKLINYYDPDGDILLLEAILNSDPSPPPPNQGISSRTRKRS
ncbi:hypothetical protein Tco_1447824 [Tanacetum coccineum]